VTAAGGTSLPQGPSAEPNLLRHRGHAMACAFEVILPRTAGAPSVQHALAELVLAEIDCWHHRLSAHDRASDVCQISRASAAGQWTSVDAELFALLSQCQALRHITSGQFSPFRQREPYGDAPSLLLDAETQRVLLAAPSQSGCTLDLGAIAKGWALDRAALLLNEHGAADYFICGGGSSAIARGVPCNGQSWSIALADSAPPGATTRHILSESGFSCSRHDGRAALAGAERAGHIWDAGRRTLIAPGDPAYLAGAAVFAASAATAEAWSTAFVATKREQLHTLLDDARELARTAPRGELSLLPTGWLLDDGQLPHPLTSPFPAAAPVPHLPL